MGCRAGRVAKVMGCPVTGRSWSAEDLRRKSWDDLHKLWYVLLKERNLLLSERDRYKAAGQVMPNGRRMTKVSLHSAQAGTDSENVNGLALSLHCVMLHTCRIGVPGHPLKVGSNCFAKALVRRLGSQGRPQRHFSKRSVNVYHSSSICD